MYKRYKEEYPIFRYALKTEGLYDEMWNELDTIFNGKNKIILGKNKRKCLGI